VLNDQLPVVNNVLRDLTPDIPLVAARTFTKHKSADPIVGKAMAILDAWEALDEARIGESPALPLTMLDPVIADAALPLWNVGKYRQAVNDAATNLNVFAQQRLGARPMMKTGFPCHAGERCRSRCPPYDVRETLRPAAGQECERRPRHNRTPAVNGPAARQPFPAAYPQAMPLALDIVVRLLACHYGE
jgi:hypothetical protein